MVHQKTHPLQHVPETLPLDRMAPVHNGKGDGMKMTMREGVVTIDTHIDWQTVKMIFAIAVIAFGLTLALEAYKYLPVFHPVHAVPGELPPPSLPTVSPLDSTWQSIQELKAQIEKAQVVYDNARLKFYRELAIQKAPEGMPWRVLFGLWRQESGLDHTSHGDGRKNKHGDMVWSAFGLGNVHVRTAQLQYGSEIKEADLLNPIVGGAVSGKVLDDYTKMFHGDLIYGIAAYQQGPGVTRAAFRDHQMPTNLSYVVRVLKYAALAE
jgi:hypothetical protein